ncbi:acetyltransferase [Leucobacter insecticola]|uniref:Acetyltransferase n=1 Tax=Leucobacter insecticola TaxID=2714934 RepID=A0A6G8FIC4_9MICO|nr:acyltransferase family protein [Leucobacter insecticola]QIM16101.1 acetyltransferase [Leucobacter insecticola]
MPAPTSPIAAPARFSGLDGLRAIAVALVLVYHLFPGVLSGGFLGVDMFFVISGFLITSLLLRELQSRGKVNLIGFWRRRARRLLPALALVLLVCSSLALLINRDLLVNIGAQLLGAAFFVSNWVFIGTGANYFARDTPELFRNTWSLSIEEQFYILLPLFILLLWRLRSRVTRAIPLLALGVFSAVSMYQMSVADVDPTRIYFGSDTHTFGLLLGAAAAALLHRSASPPSRTPDRTSSALREATTTILALTGLAVIVWLSVTLVEGSPASFQGGFQLATLAALTVVIAVTRRGVWIGRALDVQPLRWIGERSYGIYLWHWPLMLLIAASESPWKSQPSAPWIVGAITLIFTVGIAALSYRYLEQPIRKLGIRRSVRLLWSARGAINLRARPPRQRAILVTLTTALLVTVPATGFAVALAPRQSSAADAIARGQAALDARANEVASANAQAAADETSDSPSASASPKKPDATVVPIMPEGRDISALGDSVMLASLPELAEAFPNIDVDAAVSRGLGAGLEIANEFSAEGRLRSVLVVGLGTNGPIDVDDLEALRQLAVHRPLVLVNAHGERDWIPGVNQLLAEFANSYRGVVVADWDSAVAGDPDALAYDGIHPNPSGGEIYARSVQRALEELQRPEERLGFEIPRR